MTRPNSLSGSLAPGALIVALSLAVAAILTHVPWMSRALGWLGDFTSQLSTGRADWTNVVIVDLNAERSRPGRDAIRVDGAIPRDTFAVVNRYLARIGVRAVAYDVGMVEADRNDATFSSTFDSSIVLAGIGVPTYPSAAERRRRELQSVGIAANTQGADLPTLYQWADFQLPSATLTRNGRSIIGVVNTSPDEDGITRQVPLLHSAQGVLLPSMPFAALMASERLRAQVHASPGRIGLGIRSWSTTEHGAVHPRFPRNVDEIPTFTFERLASLAAGGPADQVLEDALRNRAVFIGATNPSHTGLIATPAGKISNVQLSAMSYAQLASGKVFRPPALALDLVLIAIALIPALLLAGRLELPSRTAGWAAALTATLLPAGVGFMTATIGSPVQWTFAALAGLVGIAIALSYSYFLTVEDRRRRSYENMAMEESTRLKTEFLNHLTHELRTPLTAIMGFNKINQLTDELGKEQRIANSAIIARNCDHLLALINNNLDLAKLEAGQLSISRQPEDPEPVFRDVIATMKGLSADKHIDLRYMRRTALPDALMLDVFRLRQVLINLLGNAVKFTGRGSVDLVVSWHVAVLEIEVRDTGPGIAQEALERIWQPFKQADLTIGRRFGGTGLGLAIARRLVELMGGEISVESQIGVGTTFRVRLPSEAAPRQSSSETVAPAVVGRGRLTGRILLADDNEDLRNLVTLLLRNLGLQVKGVENGLAAVEVAVTEEFDVVLMDMEMPVMNGYEAVQVLRARGYSDTIFGLTAHQEGIEVSRAILAGCDAVLTKPVSLDSLKQALTPVLERRAAMRANAALRKARS